jgi:hypothetical protein
MEQKKKYSNLISNRKNPYDGRKYDELANELKSASQKRKCGNRNEIKLPCETKLRTPSVNHYFLI